MTGGLRRGGLWGDGPPGETEGGLWGVRKRWSECPIGCPLSAKGVLSVQKCVSSVCVPRSAQYLKLCVSAYLCVCVCACA